MMTPDAEILARMQVPGWDKVFVLGCFERPATLYMQQIRALNLIYALDSSGFPKDKRIAIVGAGAAGVTAASAASMLGWPVTLLENHANDVLSLAGSATSQRWLHPHIYDWPEENASEPTAGLCILDWRAGPAIQVIRHLRAQWKKIRAAQAIDTYLHVSHVKLARVQDAYMLQWNSPDASPPPGSNTRRLRALPFDAVILAVGFGIEEETAGRPFSPIVSYWDSDKIDANLHSERQRYLVSGTGDGGLIDVLRLSFADFQHEKMLTVLRDQWLGPEQYERVRLELRQIEANVRTLKEPEAVLNLEYHKLVDSLQLLEPIQRRTEIETFLTGNSPFPLSLTAAPINRFMFLLSQAQYIPGPLVEATWVDKKWRVAFSDHPAPIPEFQAVIVRHGPNSALKKFFPEISVACDSLSSVLSTPDTTRYPKFDQQFSERLAARWRDIAGADEAPFSELPPIAEQDVSDSTVLAGLQKIVAATVNAAALLEASFIERRARPASGGTPVALDEKWMQKAGAIRLLVGGPGEGKSSVLRVWLARLSARHSLFPLYIHAREFLGEGDTVAIAIAKAIRHLGDLSEKEVAAVRTRTQAMLAVGKVLIYIDGLDEVVLDQQAQFLEKVIGTTQRHAKRNAVLMTSRFPAIELSRLLTDVFELLPVPRPGDAKPDPSNLRAFFDAMQTLLVWHGSLHALARVSLRAVYEGRFAYRADEFEAALSSAGLEDPGTLIALLLDGGYLVAQAGAVEFSHIKLREYLAAQALLHGTALAQRVAAAAMSPILRDSDVIVYAAQDVDERSMSQAFAVLPESLDWQMLRLRLRILQGPAVFPDATYMSAVMQIRHIVTDTTCGDATTLRALGASMAPSKAAFAECLMSELQLVLDAGDPVTQWRTIVLLSRMQLSSASRAIESCVASANSDVSRAAAECLGEIGDPASIPFLVTAALNPPQTVIQAHIYDAIATIGGQAAIAALSVILENDKLFQNFRWPAALALGGMGDRSVVPVLMRASASPFPNVRRHAIASLGHFHGDDVAQHLLQLLRDPDRSVRLEALRALDGHLYEPATELILGLLRQDDRAVFYMAADYLRNADRARYLAALRDILADSKAAWRGAAAESYAAEMGAEALDTLVLLSQEQDEDLRGGVARALAELRDPKAEAVLAVLAGDASADVRCYAALSLGMQDTATADDILIRLLQEDSDDEVRALAAEALHPERVRTSRAALIEALRREDRASSMAALTLGAASAQTEETIAALVGAWARTKDTGLKRNIATALGRIDNAFAATSIRRLFNAGKDEDKMILEVKALRALRHPAAIPFMLLAAMNADTHVTAYAALRNAAPEQLRAGLKLALRDPDESIRLSAAGMCVFYADDELEKILEQCSEGGSASLQLAANQAREQIAQARALSASVPGEVWSQGKSLMLS